MEKAVKCTQNVLPDFVQAWQVYSIEKKILGIFNFQSSSCEIDRIGGTR